MAQFCIPREKIEKLKVAIKALGEKNQLDTLIGLKPDKRIAAFEKVLGKEEAQLLDRELQRALASEKLNALKNWVKKNLDSKYRADKLNQAQRNSIEGFIESKLFPVARRKSGIMGIDEVMKLPYKEKIAFLKKTFGKDYQETIAEELVKAEKILKAEGGSISEAQRKINQKRIIDNYIEGKKKEIRQQSVKMDDILKMDGDKRLKFLETLMSKEDAAAAMTKIDEVTKTKLDKQIAEELVALADKKTVFGKSFKNMDEVDAFIEKKVAALADEKNGVGLTADETENFMALGKEVYESEKALKGFLPDNEEAMIRFGKAQKALFEYTEGLKPRSVWQAAFQNIGRANLLASIKTPFLNVESNALGGVSEAIGRRLSNFGANLVEGKSPLLGTFGKVDGSVVKSYKKSAINLYEQSGLDMSRMMKIDDPIVGNGKIAGEKSTKTGISGLDTYSDFVYNTLLSKWDVKFGNAAFADSLNLTATRLADGDAKKATEIFKDGALIAPQTEAGRLARAEAVSSARMATYTNDSMSSVIAGGARDLLNKTGIPVGDVLMPFVKTPANVAELGADYAGLGFAKGAWKGLRMIAGKEVRSPENIRKAVNDVVRTGLGMTFAYGVASNISVDDYMGAYDPARTGIDQLSNTNYNAIRVNVPFTKEDKWISLDYFGTLAPSINGMLYAKKYGENGHSKSLGYLSGVAAQYIAANPMFEPLNAVAGGATAFNPNNEQSVTKVVGDKLLGTLGDTLASRIVPGFVSDLAKATDEYQRDNKRGTFTLAGVNFDKLMAKIPYLGTDKIYSRKDLPIKFDGLGRLMHEESAFESMLFGARARTDTSDAVVDEIYRLRDKDQKPNIRDLRFSSSEKVAELRKKVGEEQFYEVARKFGESIAVRYIQTINTPGYKRLDDEDKKKALDKVMEDEYSKVMKKNGIKYQ